MLYKRSLEKSLKRFAKFPVVGVFGPRQSGKTTLVKYFFKKHTYLNFEDPAIRAFASENPRGFLQQYENKHGIIFDEFQYVPQLLSYIQLAADAHDRPGYFVLTGSQNFLMNQAITQSLAGRIGILTLLPLSIAELTKNKLIDEYVYETIFRGGYPGVYAKGLTPLELYPSYIHSYVERDVRQLVNVENLDTFQRFMQLCAGRVGQLLNVADLAVSCGINQKTVHSWLSILEASYILFLLQPYHVNFNKRITKSPKIYFFDTGIVCSLLNIRSSDELALSLFKGALFENFMIADLYKQYVHRGLRVPLYFWRDMNGRVEIDCLIDQGISLLPIEIKSGATPMASYFDSLRSWHEIATAVPAAQQAKKTPRLGYVVYAGDMAQKRSQGNLIGWQEAGDLVAALEGDAA